MFIRRFGASILAIAAVSSVAVSASADEPPRCVQGFVWREARAGDYVCVTPDMRDQVAYDNSVAAQRWTNGDYGPQTCIQGFVWREAFSGDYVCVTPDVRTITAQDNAAASSRWVPYTCSSCNDSSCQCGYDSEDDLCADHGGVNPELGCVVQEGAAAPPAVHHDFRADDVGACTCSSFLGLDCVVQEDRCSPGWHPECHCSFGDNPCTCEPN